MAITPDRLSTVAPGANDAPLSRYVLTLVENTRREVGLAAVDLEGAPEISLCQLADDKVYSKSMSMLARYEPTVVVYCASAGKGDVIGGLAGTVRRSDIASAHCDAFPRKFFSEQAGLERVRELSVKGEAATVENELAPLYLALAAANALVEYCRWKLGAHMHAHAVRFKLVQVSGYMLVDPSTLANLEVLANARTGDTKQCLFGVLNKCRTRGGQRLLRASLRMPLRDRPSIVARQACVQELLSSNKLFEDALRALEPFGDVDAVLRAISRKQPAEGAAGTQQAGLQARAVAQLTGLLRLRHLLGLVAQLEGALTQKGTREPESAILRKCVEQLRRPALGAIIARLDAVISPDLDLSRAKQPGTHVEALREGISSVLDHTRAVWRQSYKDLHTLVDMYNEDASGARVFSLGYNPRRGYHLNAPLSVRADLDGTFLHVAHVSKKTLACSTSQLEQVNARMRKTYEEIVLLNDKEIEDVLKAVRADMLHLYLLSESIHLVDMMAALAELATLSSEEYVLPEITADGPLVVRSGRHVLLEHLGSVDEPMPNSVYLSEASNFVLLTGPNMSGKSTLLQQNMLIVLLAHIGALVPAQFASVPVFDRLFSRLGSGDCLESNASTFTVEMLDVAHIAKAIAHEPEMRALVVIDELGRGTSNSEGLAIAWAVAEHLAESRRLYSLFATHFLQLQDLAKLYANVRCFTMTVVQDVQNARFAMPHRMTEGTSERLDLLTGALAAVAGIPPSFTERARAIAASLSERTICAVTTTTEKCATHRIAEMCLNLRHSSLTEDSAELRTMLLELQQEARVVVGSAQPGTAGCAAPDGVVDCA